MNSRVSKPVAAVDIFTGMVLATKIPIWVNVLVIFTVTEIVVSWQLPKVLKHYTYYILMALSRGETIHSSLVNSLLVTRHSLTSDEWRVTSDEWRVTSDEWRVTSNEWKYLFCKTQWQCHPRSIVVAPLLALIRFVVKEEEFFFTFVKRCLFVCLAHRFISSHTAVNTTTWPD